MLTIEQISCGFGRQEILHDISLTIPEGKITAIVGQSGCGKTTFLKTLNRMIEEEGGFYKGKIILDGEDIKGLSTEVLRTRIGMVFQQPIAFPYSIEKNLSYVLKYHGIREAGEIERITRECLQKARLYDEIKDQLKKSAKKLSGGQKQRLAIARSLCVELKGKYTFVIVTHNLAQAKRIADQIIFMDQGRVLEVTDTKTFFEHPSSEPAREQIQYM